MITQNPKNLETKGPQDRNKRESFFAMSITPGGSWKFPSPFCPPVEGLRFQQPGGSWKFPSPVCLMRQIIMVIIIAVSVPVLSSAQSGNYEKAMLGAIEKMNNAGTIPDYIDAANIFERIGNSEKSEWLPYYHAAYCYVSAGHIEGDIQKKDPWFDKAQQFLDKALKIAPDESELYVLQAFIYPGRMVVDPMGRGMELMGRMNAALDKAISLNPGNPRSYFLRAMTLLNMPEAFGGGPEIARPLFETAKEKFEAFEPESPLWPVWGKEQNEEELSKL